MAHIKASGVTAGNRDAIAKRLGVKIFSGQKVAAGAILVRQRGTKFFAGDGASRGSDDTIFAVISGKVAFSQKFGKKFVSVD